MTLSRPIPTTPRPSREAIQRWAVLAFALVLGLAVFLRSAYYLGEGHPDEGIAIAVVGQMHATKSWDTNWVHAPVAEHFRYNQYNFSSYHVALSVFHRLVHGVDWPEAWANLKAGVAVHRGFSVIMGILVAAQTVWLARRIAGDLVAIGSGLLVAVFPILVQDAHYIRAEAFVTSLTLLLISLSLRPVDRLSLRPCVAGFVLGLMVACKVSLLLLGWIPFVALLGCTLNLRQAFGLGVSVALGAAAGFALGAPGAVLHSEAYVHGVTQLMKQYAGLHPPHSHLDGSATADLLFRYFFDTSGWPLALLSMVGLLKLIWAQQWRILLLIGMPLLLFFGYFSTQSVFFERNLSHVIPLYLILGAVGATALVAGIPRIQGVRSAAAITLFLTMAVRPFGITHRFIFDEMSGDANARQKAYDLALKAKYPDALWREETLIVGLPQEALAPAAAVDARPILLRVADYNDEWNAAHLPLLFEKFEVEALGDRPSSFENISVCTLHTYHRASYRYFLLTGPKTPAAN